MQQFFYTQYKILYSIHTFLALRLSDIKSGTIAADADDADDDDDDIIRYT